MTGLVTVTDRGRAEAVVARHLSAVQDSPSASPDPAAQALRRQELRLAAAPMLLALFLAAMDSTVVGTLLPAIKQQMRDVDLYPWLLSGFLLATALAMPLAGAVSDRYGDKATMLAALTFFGAGSAAIWFAPTMGWLIWARVLQGVGAGGLTVMVYVMMGKAFTGESRARMQGLLSGVWGLAAILGPSVGVAVLEQFGWRAVFAINLPVVVVAIVLVLRYVRSGDAGDVDRSTLDWPAFILLTGFLCALLLLIMSPSLSLSHHLMVGLTTVLVATLTVQVAYLRPVQGRGRHAAAPVDRSVLPLPLLTERRYLVAGALTLLAAATLYGSVTLLPLYLRVRNGSRALDSGAVVTAGSLGWVVGSATCGLLIGRLGYRPTALLGSILLTAGPGLLYTSESSSMLIPVAAQVIVGLGTGFITATTLIYIQTVSEPARLGAFTSSVNLIRNVGAAIGINILSSMQISYFSHAAKTAADPRDALLASFRQSFLVMTLMAACCVFAALLISGQTRESRPSREAAPTRRRRAA